MFYRELRPQGFGLLTVTQDPAVDVIKMVEYNGITHPIVSDSKVPATESVYAKYHAYDGKHYLIRSDGTIVATFSKLGISLPVLRKELAKHGIGPSTSAAPPKVTPAPGAVSRAEPVTWKLSAAPAAPAPGATLSVALAATIAPGWRIYAMNQGGGGPTPLEIRLGAGPFRLARAVTFSPPEVKFDPNFGADVSLHQERAEFVLPVTVAAGTKAGRQSIVVEARYQACNATICLPPQTDTVRLPITIK
jgi:cytochrome c biogenesis DsbD-like protein